MIVSTAIQPSVASFAMVGLRSAGSAWSSSASRFSGRFIFKPTLSRAANAPWSSSTSVSIFAFFHASPSAPWFAMNCGDDSMIVSKIRSLLARSDEPVSVTSTMASTRSGTFTSVAPHENSTAAVTPFLARKARVISTASVAITLPCKSCTERIAESSGTAMTHRVGLLLTLEKVISASTATSLELLAIQSLPVSPQSRNPCST